MCTYLWNHHHSQGSKHIHHLQSLSPVLYCVVVVLVGRALTVTSALLTDCDACSTELFTLSTVLGSRLLEFTCPVQLRLCTHWRWRSPLHLSIKLLATPTLLSASGSLPLLNFLRTWNHEISVFLRCNSVLQIHPCTLHTAGISASFLLGCINLHPTLFWGLALVSLQFPELTFLPFSGLISATARRSPSLSCHTQFLQHSQG